MHQPNVGLFFLLRERIPLGGQLAFFGRRITDQPLGFEPGDDLFRVQRLSRRRRSYVSFLACQPLHLSLQPLYPCSEFYELPL